MKKLLAYLLALAMLLSMPLGATAETAKLVYSYGDEAFNKHMLDISNTLVFNDKTWVFDFGSYNFDFVSDFSLYGGNTRTLLEFEVPRVWFAGLPATEDLHLGTLTISNAQPMTLYIFSGDRTQNLYKLIGMEETQNYTLDVSAQRDENGTFRLIDMIFLLTYTEGYTQKYYATSLYIAYEGYTAAPPADAPLAEGVITDTPVNESQAQLSPEAATYANMVRILTEERNTLKTQIEELEAQLGSTDSTADSTQLNEQIEQLKADNIKLQNQVNTLSGLREINAQLVTENAALKIEADKVTILNDQVTQLTQENAFLKATTPDTTTLNEQLEELKAENADLASDLSDAEALIAELEAQIALLEANEDSDNEQASDDEMTDEQITELEDMSMQLLTEGDEMSDEELAALLERYNLMKETKQKATSTPAATNTPAPAATEAPVITAAPTATPTPEPTEAPTPVPTEVPTAEPTAEPTAVPTPEPTAEPTPEPIPEVDREEALALLSGTWRGKVSKTVGNTTRSFNYMLVFWSDGRCDWMDTSVSIGQTAVEWSLTEEALILRNGDTEMVFQVLTEEGGSMKLQHADGTLLENKRYSAE